MGRLSTVKVGAAMALLMATVVAGALRWGMPASAPTARGAVTLVYVGAEDCAPCRAWQLTEGKQFRASVEFAHLVYREVKSPTLRDLLNDEHWPEDLRGYRDRLGRGAGVPLWLIISGDEIVERGFGAGQWQAAVLPRVKSLVR
jgi:hypothetical protein